MGGWEMGGEGKRRNVKREGESRERRVKCWEMGREGRGRKVKRRERRGVKGEESEVLGDGRGREGEERAWAGEAGMDHLCLYRFVCVSLLHSPITFVSLSSPLPLYQGSLSLTGATVFLCRMTTA